MRRDFLTIALSHRDVKNLEQTAAKQKLSFFTERLQPKRLVFFSQLSEENAPVCLASLEVRADKEVFLSVPHTNPSCVTNLIRTIRVSRVCLLNYQCFRCGVIQGGRLFEGGVCLKITFLKSLTRVTVNRF